MKNTPQDQSRAKLPTIQQIRRKHNLTSRIVANAANVDFRTEYRLEIGAFVDQGDVLKILQALSTLTGEQYTLENVAGLSVTTPRIHEEQNPRYS